MSPAKFRWGILFILVGGLLLLNNMEWLEWWIWADILSLWPLILIAIGVEKIFAKTRLEIISYLAPLALAVAVVWVAWGGSTAKSYFGSEKSRYKYRINEDETIDKLIVSFEMNDSDLVLRSSRRDLFSYRKASFRRPPEIDYDTDGSVGILKIRPRESWRIVFGRRHVAGDLNAYVTEDKPVIIRCRGDDSDMRLDCRKLLLEELEVDSEEGHIRIYVGKLLDTVKIRLDGPDADFRLTLPADCGLRVDGVNGEIARYLERIGLEGTGSEYCVPAIDSLVPQIALELGHNISRLLIEYY